MKHSQTPYRAFFLIKSPAKWHIVLGLFVTLFSNTWKAQSQSPVVICGGNPVALSQNLSPNLNTPNARKLTPGGHMDVLSDGNGNKFLLSDLEINTSSGGGSGSRAAATYTCQAGFIKLFFTASSGMGGSSSTDIARRSVVCQAFTDMAAFIHPAFAASGSSVTVNVLIDDILIAYPGASTLNLAGTSSAFYAYPSNPASPNPGIIDNLAYKTIKTMQDGYTGVVPPMAMSSASGFYHAFVAFNFANTGINWATNLSLNPTAGQTDLYSVAIHELSHALGFGSLIDANGQSRIGAANNYYARYDRFLRTSTNTPLLSATNGCTSQYGLVFGVSPAVLGNSGCISNPANSTNCGTAIKYLSPSTSSVPVYNPNCYETGSSLSHFEDMCYPSPVAYGNDAYFVMCNQINPGSSKRYIREEERKVFCDMGYPVNSVYASPAFSANTTYTYGCNAPNIWGINDGILPGNTYAYVATGANLNIPVSGVMANDAPTTTQIKCVESVYNNGVAVLSGGNIQFTANPGYFGVVVIRYIPVDGSGNEGNITYVFGFINNSNCSGFSVCDMVPNGNFEATTGCGTYDPSVYFNCWSAFNFTPDVFKRGCTTSNAIAPANLGTNTYNSAPVMDSYNGLANTAIAGLYGRTSLTGTNNTAVSEVLSNQLTTNLIPGQVYQLRLKVFNYKGNLQNPLFAGVTHTVNQPAFPVVVSVSSSSNVLLASAAYYPETPMLASGAMDVLQSFTLNTSNINTWQNYTYTFTYAPTGGQNGKYLYIGIDCPKTSAYFSQFGWPGTIETYIALDEVSIVPINQALTFSPPVQCYGPVTYSNLNQYVSPTTFSYTMSGTGVSYNGSTYAFNSPPSLAPGVYTISLTYTNSLNCVTTLQQTVYNSSVTVLTNTANCSASNYTILPLGFTPATTFYWLPMGITSPSLVVSPATAMTYTLYALGGTGYCNTTYTIPVVPPSGPPVISGVPPVCIGSISNYTLNSFVPSLSTTGGTFNGLGIMAQSCPVPFGNCFQINLMPPATYTPGVYTYTYTGFANPLNGMYCPTTSTFNVQFLPDFSLAINGATCFTGGNSYTLSASTASLSGITYTWLPGGQTTPNLVITPTASTVYTLLASNGGCVRSATLSVVPNVPVGFVNPPAQICTFQSILNLQNYLAPGVPTNGTWGSVSGLGTFYSPSPGVTHLNVNPALTTLGTHTITYSYPSSTNSLCLVSNSFTINVSQGFLLNTSAPVTVCRNIPSNNTATLTANGTPVPPSGITYAWQPGALSGAVQIVSPTVTTVYTITATSGACSFSASIAVSTRTDCCNAAVYLSNPVINAATLTAGSYAINQNVTINGAVNALNCEFRIASGVKITIPNASSLKLDNTHFYTCSDVQMWQGFDVLNGGRIEMRQSLIEDAFTAVNSDGSVTTSTLQSQIDVYLEENVFNKNLTGVSIKNYVMPVQNGPFYIGHNVFTCRLIPFTSTSWQHAWNFGTGLRAAGTPANALGSPYLNLQSYLPTNLKQPLNFMSSSIGVYLENAGTGVNFSGTPAYSGVMIGDVNDTDFDHAFNLFDNLYFGIYAKNGNVESYSNVFQNIKRGLNGSQPYGGVGIFATADSLQATNNKVNIVNPLYALSTTSLINKFYDCHTAIHLTNILTANLKYADIRSSQLAATPPSNTLLLSGATGIRINGNRFNGYEVSNNQIRNVQTGISLNAHYGLISIAGLPSYGRLLYTIRIQNNQIMPQVNTSAAIAGQRVGLGIYAASASNSSGAEITASNQVLRIENNAIDRAYRGVQLLNWRNGGFWALAGTNTVTLVQDVNPSPQYGVSASNCRANAINGNLITGFNTSQIQVAGIYSSTNPLSKVECNSVTNLYAGFEFAGVQNGTSWKNNTLQTNQHGLRMINAAELGTQGSLSSPADNRWNGTWGGGLFHTFTDASITPSLSALVVRNSAGYFPSNNGNITNNNAQKYLLAPNTVSLSNTNNGALNCAPSVGGGGGCTSCNPAAVAALSDIAGDNVTYSVNIEETKEINKNVVFDEISREPNLAQANVVLSEFYADNLLGSRGKYKSIEEDLGTGDFNGVDGTLSGFTPLTNIENNYKQYYELERIFNDVQTLSPSELNTLRLIAYQCPFLDGSVVYKARVLFNMITATEVQYHDVDCIKDGYSYSKTSASDAGDELENQLKNREREMSERFKNAISYYLFPNPAQDKITIVGSVKDQVLTVSITDVNGKQLSRQKMSVEAYQFNMNLNLKNGIYFVTLEDQSGLRTVKKLIIAK